VAQVGHPAKVTPVDRRLMSLNRGPLARSAPGR
jgi:hypothetical protein